MKLDEAKAECERWLAYLKKLEEKTGAIQRVAADVRSGKLSSDEGRRLVRKINGSPTVYDGAKLADAVRLLLKQVA